MWTTLNIKVTFILRVGRKWKGRAGDNYKSTLNIEFEQDWSVGLGATLGADKKFKIFILSKMAPTIFIKFCRFIVHSTPQQYDAIAYSWKNPWN